MIRVCTFIDGFNLYHAIDDLTDNRLKWLDLKKLVGHFLDPKIHELIDVYYFSAFATWKKDAYSRHLLYEKALKNSGVKTVMGKFKEKDRYCRSCNARWKAHEEKETDVNIALYLLDGAYQDLYDEAIVISQDSDLFPAIKLVKQRFPQKTIKIITPPNMRHSKEMAQIVGKKLGKIQLVHLERSQFPEIVQNGSGKGDAVRPEKYGRK